MTEWFKSRRSKIRTQSPILLWNNEVPAIEPLCREEGPPRWPPSSRECSPLVLIPEPARGSLMWEKTLWKAVAERRTECDSLFLHSEGPTEIHLAVVSTLLNNILMEPVSLDWLLVCLEQLAARETLNGVARLSAPLRSRVDKTERHPRLSPLHPGTLAALAERSHEDAEERRTLCNVVHPLFPSRGRPQQSRT